MPLLEIRLAVFCLDGSELALEDRHEEISAAASRLEEARVDALGLSFDQIEHLFDKPWRREYFAVIGDPLRSEEHTSELQSLMRISYAVFCLTKKKSSTHLAAKHMRYTTNNTEVQ